MREVHADRRGQRALFEDDVREDYGSQLPAAGETAGEDVTDAEVIEDPEDVAGGGSVDAPLEGGVDASRDDGEVVTGEPLADDPEPEREAEDVVAPKQREPAYSPAAFVHRVSSPGQRRAPRWQDQAFGGPRRGW
jgi:hypothetical protein